MEFTVVGGLRASLGESPLWDDRRQALFHVDLAGRLLVRTDGSGAETARHAFESEVCSLGLAESGRLVVALRDEIVLFDPDGGGRTTLAKVALPPEHRLNDGKVGPDGAFWVGAMDERPEKQPDSPLLRIGADGRVHDTGVRAVISNGLAWSADGRSLFHTDSRGAWIDRWRFDPASGALSDRRRIATPDEATGRPDGGACDVDGVYWSAGVSAACLNRWSSEGALLERIPVPVAAPTMPCFAGPDLRTLFVTSLSQVSAERLRSHPETGRLIRARSPVAGVPVARFRGA